MEPHKDMTYMEQLQRLALVGMRTGAMKTIQ